MTTSTQVHKLLESIGPYVKGLDAIIRFDEENFGIQFDDESGMGVHCEPEAHQLTLTRLVGAIPESRQREIHEAILRANGLWQQSGGVSAALDDDDQLVLVRHLFAEVDVPILVAVIEDTLDKADAWKCVLEDRDHEAQTEVADEADQAGYVKV